MRQRLLLVGLLALAGAFSALAGARLKSSEPLASMDHKPTHRWDIAAWLQLHDEEATQALHGRLPELSGKQFVWSHVKVEEQALHGLSLIPGKRKFYAVSIPIIEQGALWAARDGKVIVGYKRKVSFTENRDGFVIVGIDKARIASDKFAYAENITVYVDEDGKIYY